MCITGIMSAQDIVTLKTGEDLRVRVLEVLKNEIKYKHLDNPDGPVFTLEKSDILMITYQNGMREIIKSSPAKVTYNYYGGYYQAANGLYAISVDELRPNMKYRDLKGIYSASSWDGRRVGDPYNSAGWCWNFLLTGLGQMTMGEGGRGAAFLGAQVGCYIVSNIGLFVVGSPTMIILGNVGALTTWIWSMVDAANVMKIKNMYARDMRSFASNVGFNLSPWVCPAPIAHGNYTTAAGLSLTMRF